MTGRTVIVTGGSSGIGKATAEHLAELGATVAITGRDPARTHDAANQIRTSTGTSVQAFAADLSDPAQVRQLAADLLAALPRIDVLVNNAGGYWNTRHITEAVAKWGAVPTWEWPRDAAVMDWVSSARGRASPCAVRWPLGGS